MDWCARTRLTTFCMSCRDRQGKQLLPGASQHRELTTRHQRRSRCAQQLQASARAMSTCTCINWHICCALQHVAIQGAAADWNSKLALVHIMLETSKAVNDTCCMRRQGSHGHHRPQEEQQGVLCRIQTNLTVTKASEGCNRPCSAS